MRVAIYARVSTKDQKPDSQLHALRETAQRRGFSIIEEFVDIGVSGAKTSRPALNRLMDAARKRHIDLVLVFRFDRFARSTTHLAAALDEFGSLGVQFISHSENIDTTTPMGKAMFTMISAMAQFERDIIKERVNAGLAVARAAGKHCGRPQEVSIEKVKELRAGGLSLGNIAKELKVSKSSVAKALKK